MYEFNYQHIVPGGPNIVCVVPAPWLEQNLPTMGGNVAYMDNFDVIDLPDFIFQFTDDISECSSFVHLTILQRYSEGKSGIGSLSGNVLKISYDASVVNTHHRETYLLNHLFGCLALSASVGNIYLDFGEAARWVAKQSELEFAFATGGELTVIPPQLRRYFPDDENSSTFAMLFCREEDMRLEYLSMLAKPFTQGGPSMVSDVAVSAEQMLISVLAGESKR